MPRPIVTRPEPLVPTSTTLWWVFLGGCIGTALRAGIGVTLSHTDAAPWTATITVNLLGTFLLGVLIAWLRRQPLPPRWAQPLLGVGVFGSFTTYSALAVDAVGLGREVGGAWMIGHPALSLLLGLGAMVVGLRLGASIHTTSQDPPC